MHTQEAGDSGCVQMRLGAGPRVPLTTSPTHQLRNKAVYEQGKLQQHQPVSLKVQLVVYSWKPGEGNLIWPGVASVRTEKGGRLEKSDQFVHRGQFVVLSDLVSRDENWPVCICSVCVCLFYAAC